jgi:hypothetical protein
MKQFAGNLLTIAQEYQFDPLQQYAENLHNCISHFDINGITAMLREFPELHQRLQLAQE